MNSTVIENMGSLTSNGNKIAASISIDSNICNDSNTCKLLASEANPEFNSDSTLRNEASNVNGTVAAGENIILNGEDDIDMMKLCSNCLNDFNSKNEEYFENDECGHVLCKKCRFVQDSICRLCKMKRQEELESSVALDLSTGFSSYSIENQSSNSLNNNNSIAGNRKKKKVKIFQVPDYIHVLSKDPVEYQCSFCERKFHYKLQAKYHEACSTGQRPLKCDFCDKTFIKKCHFEYHTRTHSGVKPFVCFICDKRFIQKSKLTRHMKIHTGQREVFKCEKCNVCLLSKQRFKIHVLTHTNERPFHCKKCQRTFRDKINLSIHEASKHSDEKNFVCEDCGKAFKLKTNFIKHQRLHFGFKSFPCKVDGCSSRFATRRDMVRHMQTHSTDLEYDYECSICMTGFRRKDNLERHMKTSHPESITELGNRRQIVTVVKVKALPTSNDNTEGVATDNNVSSAPLKESSVVQKVGLREKELLSGIRKSKISCSSKSYSKSNKKSLNKLKTVKVSCTKVTNAGNDNNISDEKLVSNDNRETQLNNYVRASVVKGNDKENLDSLTEALLDSMLSPDAAVAAGAGKPSMVVEKETLPKFQKVSVISNSKKYLNDEKQLAKSNENSSKKTETVSPFRLITPSFKSANGDGSNCVPTITKVMHIVHTSDTGVSNVRTVITTKGVTDKPKANKLNSTGNKNKGTTGSNLNSSVIKYVPKSTKNTPQMKHKCYRVLGENSNSRTLTYNCSYQQNIIDNVLAMDREPIHNTRSNVIQSETNLSDKNVSVGVTDKCNDTVNNYNDYNENYNTFFNNSSTLNDYNLGNNILNNFDNCSCNEMENAIGQCQIDNFYNSNKINYFPSTSDTFTSNQIIQSFEGTSESCLLADNALDESITASLDLENEYSNQYNRGRSGAIENYESLQLNGENVAPVISPNNSNLVTQDYLNTNYVNTKQSHNGPSNLSSNVDSYVQGDPIDGFRTLSDVVSCALNESNNQLVTNNDLHESPLSYCYDNSFEDAVSATLKNVNYDYSENIHQSFVNNNPNFSLDNNKPSNNFQSNGLFTVGDVACERANSVD